MEFEFLVGRLKELSARIIQRILVKEAVKWTTIMHLTGATESMVCNLQGRKFLVQVEPSVCIVESCTCPSECATQIEDGWEPPACWPPFCLIHQTGLFRFWWFRRWRKLWNSNIARTRNYNSGKNFVLEDKRNFLGGDVMGNSMVC